MKVTTFLSVNNENLGAIAHMSNGTLICIVYKGVKVAPKKGFQKYVWVTSLALNPLPGDAYKKCWPSTKLQTLIKVKGYTCRFAAIFHTGDNFCDFLLAFLYTSEYGVTLKGKNLFTLL